MTTYADVDVFLGHPLVDPHEKLFLARLRRDLGAADVSARILANFQVGKSFLELDFVVVTEARAAVVELKAWRDPVVARPNGRWQRLVEGRQIEAGGNPYRQTRDYGFALSDEMKAYASRVGAPGPRKDKFVKDLDLLVCMYPELRPGSTVERDPHVRLVGYDEMLARLVQPGRAPAWSASDWDGFIRRLGLYRAEDDSDTAVALRQSAATTDEYCARFSAAHSDLPTMVSTTVRHDGAQAQRPDLAGLLLSGRDVLLYGTSGQGKSLWARDVARELARRGHLPVWLPVRSYDGDFATFLARAVAPYTTRSAAQAVASARAAGRHVAFILDGLNERSGEAQSELLSALRALRLNASSHAVLVTAQEPVAPGFAGIEMVGLQPLSDEERQQVLRAYGSDLTPDGLVGLSTPLDLSIAASCAPGVTAADGPAAFIDAYVDAVAADAPTRVALVRLAGRMHEQLRLSLRAADASRVVRRELGLDVGEVARTLSCRLIRHEQGRVAFSHERFATFLAAEHLLEHAEDGRQAGEALNQPRFADLRRDAIGLESDPGRLRAMLEATLDVELLVAAADRELGIAAERAAHQVLDEALLRGITTTVEGLATFEPSDSWPAGDAWRMETPPDEKERTRLVAAGRCAALGLHVERVARLLVVTEKLRSVAAAGLRLGEARTFQTTYACGRGLGELELPAALVAHGMSSARSTADLDPRTRGAAHALWASEAGRGDGAVLLALQLLRLPEQEDATLYTDLVTHGLSARPYHLQLAAFDAVQRAGSLLGEDAHTRVLDAVESVETDNIFLQSSQVEALGALGAIAPVNDLADLKQQLQLILSDPDDANHCKLAYGAFSSQFEEAVVGRWTEAIDLLHPEQLTLLFSMALRSQDDGFGIATSWILEQNLDLSDPRLRAAVMEFVGRQDPARWTSPQHSLGSAIAAVRLLARAGLALPGSSASKHREGWETFLALIAAITAGVNEATLACASTLIEEHPTLVADLLDGLHSAQVVMFNDGTEQLETEIIAALGAPLVGVLLDGLQRPETLVGFSRFGNSARHSVALLGQIGDQTVADALRAFADDPALGPGAVAAVREIEARP